MTRLGPLLVDTKAILEWTRANRRARRAYFLRGEYVPLKGCACDECERARQAGSRQVRWPS